MNFNLPDISRMLVQSGAISAPGTPGIVTSGSGSGTTEFNENLQTAFAKLEAIVKDDSQADHRGGAQNSKLKQAAAAVRNVLFENAQGKFGTNHTADVNREKILANLEKTLAGKSLKANPIPVGQNDKRKQAAAEIWNILFAKIQGQHTRDFETKSGSVGHGEKILSALRNALIKLVDGNLKTATVSPQGLDALRDLLAAAGFNLEAVNGIMNDLKEQAGAAQIPLDTVLAALSPLKDPQVFKTDEADVYLETSALAFLTVIIEQFGLPKEDVRHIVEQADEGQKGINLSHIFQRLCDIETQARQAGVIITAPNEQRQFSKWVKGLNISLPETDGNEDVTLKDLLTAFDNYIQSKSKVQTGTNTLAQSSTSDAIKSEPVFQQPLARSHTANAAMVNRFIQSVSVNDGSADAQPQFSYLQIKNRLKDDMLIPEKEKTLKHGLSSVNGHPDTDPLVKAAASVLSKQGRSNLADSNHTATGHEGKTEISTPGDILHSATVPGKRDFADNMFNPVKAKSSERALPSYVTTQVNKSIVRAVNNGESSLKIQLKPAALGRLTLTIDNTGNSIKVSIVTEHQATRDMLTANVGELRTTLQSSGINLDSFDVNMGSEFKQSMADAGNQAGQFSRRNKKHNGGSGTGSGDLVGEELTVPDGPVSETPSNSAYYFVA